MKKAMLLGLAFWVGCGGFIDKQAADSTLRILSKSQAAGRRQVDIELVQAALPGGVLQLETFALAYPEHRGFRLLHADALCQYAAAFVFDEWEQADLDGRKDEAMQLASRVVKLTAACAEANLALAPASWRAARAVGGERWDAEVTKASRKHVAQLLWLATADAVVLALEPMKHLTQLPSIIAALEKCVSLAPGFRDSDAEILLGTLQAGSSQFLGGADGGEWFARAQKQLGPGGLVAEVMMARSTLVARRDRAQFTAKLQAVLAIDLAKFPDQRLANELAQRKARRYLAAAGRFF